MDGEKLYEKRELLAQKLMECLRFRGITKVELCRRTGISRPTLDRLLHGEISSQATFMKHMDKILTALRMTAGELLHFAGAPVEASGGRLQTENLSDGAKRQYTLMFQALTLWQEART